MICSRKEFMALAGIKQNGHLTTFIQRGKIIPESDGSIDTEKRENKDFIASRASKGIATPQAEALTNTVPQVETIKEIKEPVSKKVKKAEENAKISKWEVDLAKAQAELEYKLASTKMVNQKLSILAGDNLPIRDIKQILSQYSKSILHGYNAFLEQKISDLCHQFRIPNKEKSKILTKNTVEINKIHAKIENDIRTQLKNAIGKSKLKESNSDELDD
jgi:hypothetical protein